MKVEAVVFKPMRVGDGKQGIKLAWPNRTHAKNHLQRFIGLKTTRPDPLLMPLRLLPKYRKPNHIRYLCFSRC